MGHSETDLPFKRKCHVKDTHAQILNVYLHSIKHICNKMEGIKDLLQKKESDEITENVVYIRILLTSFVEPSRT